MKVYTVNCQWDSDAGVWYVADTDVPGLATEAETIEKLERKLLVMVPELLELNDSHASGQEVPFELGVRHRPFSCCHASPASASAGSSIRKYPLVSRIGPGAPCKLMGIAVSSWRAWAGH